MKQHLKSIPKLWNELEMSADISLRIVGVGDNKDSYLCVADCGADFAGEPIAHLIRTFSSTPENIVQLNYAIKADLKYAAAQ